MRVLIVDDEPLARRRLRRLLMGRADVAPVGECRNGREAVATIRELRPDLVLLDVQMPDLDGFGVLAEVGAESMPLVLFVTAYDEYALAAFDVSALDYLLKPFDDERFERALERALARHRERDPGRLTARLESLLAGHRLRTGDERPEGGGAPKRLAVRRGGSTFFVPIADLDWIEAQGVYARLHAAERSYLIRRSLERLARELAAWGFVRIHRSALVRADRVRELAPLFHGEYRVVLVDGTELKLTRTYRAGLERLMSGG